jgi:hypothetical protein
VKEQMTAHDATTLRRMREALEHRMQVGVNDLVLGVTPKSARFAIVAAEQVARDAAVVEPELRRGHKWGDGESGPSSELTMHFSFKPPLTVEEELAWRLFVSRMGGGWPSQSEDSNPSQRSHEREQG